MKSSKKKRKKEWMNEWMNDCIDKYVLRTSAIIMFMTVLHGCVSSKACCDSPRIFIYECARVKRWALNGMAIVGATFTIRFPIEFFFYFAGVSIRCKFNANIWFIGSENNLNNLENVWVCCALFII